MKDWIEVSLGREIERIREHRRVLGAMFGSFNIWVLTAYICCLWKFCELYIHNMCILFCWMLCISKKLRGEISFRGSSSLEEIDR